MIRFTDTELSGMREELRRIETNSENSLQLAERSCNVIQQCMARLKEFILSYTFSNEEEEILFFKEIKPRFLKELIYYAEVYHLEAALPPGDKEKQAEYYKSRMNSISLFFERNQQLYLYYRIRKSSDDRVYFTRQEEALPLTSECLELDPRFSTLYSCLLSRLQAYEMLTDYIVTAIDNLYKKPEERQVPAKTRGKGATWTDAKVYLIEFGYAIFASGAVNHGKAEVKEIMEALQLAFNIDLGNYYSVFNHNIRLRKKNRTQGTDQSKESLIRYMDSLD